MQLLDYLNNHFITLSQLLSLTQISEQTLRQYQQQGLVPQASYHLNLDVYCESFFGHHQQHSDYEYYAKGYVNWLGIVQALDDQESIYRVFSYRYKQTIEGLKAQGYHSTDAKLNEKLSDHIKTEWTHFLSGTYGLCTRSGLPEDIAAKELAIAQINELTAQSELDESKIEALTHAVNLLDGASSMFAPHELKRSSRYRLVDEVRRKYKLQCQRHIEG